MNSFLSVRLRNFTKIFKNNQIILILVIIAIVLTFGLIEPVFFKFANFINIMRAISTLGILSLGVTFVMIAAEIDFSVGAMVALGGSMAGVLISKVGILNWVVLIIVLISGALAGLINGTIAVKLRVPSFLATLGTSMVYATLALVVTKGIPIQSFEEARFFSVFSGKLYLIRVETIWLIVLAIIFHLIISKTYYGYYLFATGGNREAAMISGIKVDNIKITAFVLSGVLAFFVGIISMSHLKMASPVTGLGTQLYVIAAVIMGGTRLIGGVGSISGTLLGVILMGLLNNGLIVLGVSTYYHEGFIGIILLLSIIIQSRFAKKKI